MIGEPACLVRCAGFFRLGEARAWRLLVKGVYRCEGFSDRLRSLTPALSQGERGPS